MSSISRTAKYREKLKSSGYGIVEMRIHQDIIDLMNKFSKLVNIPRTKLIEKEFSHYFNHEIFKDNLISMISRLEKQKATK